MTDFLTANIETLQVNGHLVVLTGMVCLTVLLGFRYMNYFAALFILGVSVYSLQQAFLQTQKSESSASTIHAEQHAAGPASSATGHQAKAKGHRESGWDGSLWAASQTPWINTHPTGQKRRA